MVVHVHLILYYNIYSFKLVDKIDLIKNIVPFVHSSRINIIVNSIFKLVGTVELGLDENV